MIPLALLRPLLPYAIGAAVLLGAIGGAWLWLARHDAGLRTAWLAEQAAAVAEARETARREGDAALADALESAARRARQSATVRTEIAHAPPSACPLPAAVTLAADELRRRAAGGTAAGGARGPAGAMPRSARP